MSTSYWLTQFIVCFHETALYLVCSKLSNGFRLHKCEIGFNSSKSLLLPMYAFFFPHFVSKDYKHSYNNGHTGSDTSHLIPCPESCQQTIPMKTTKTGEEWTDAFPQYSPSPWQFTAWWILEPDTVFMLITCNAFFFH